MIYLFVFLNFKNVFLPTEITSDLNTLKSFELTIK